MTSLDIPNGDTAAFQPSVSWSLSEFLNQIEFRSQSWCVVELGSGYALQVPPADAAYCYLLIDGEVAVHSAGVPDRRCTAGDVLFVLSGHSHMLSLSTAPRRHVIPFLQDGGYVDSPPTLTIGAAPIDARILSGRLKVRWPTGRRLKGLPDYLSASGDTLNLDVLPYVRSARGDGAAAMLTRLANLIFVTAFRQDGDCAALFGDSIERDPIDRAQRLIELHPGVAWTVDLLARKVGMSRSSFAGSFVGETGLTPMATVSRERMRLAATLLASSDLKVSEIGERVGYRSEAAFHHRFIAHFGVRPGQYRRDRRRHGGTPPDI